MKNRALTKTDLSSPEVNESLQSYVISSLNFHQFVLLTLPIFDLSTLLTSHGILY